MKYRIRTSYERTCLMYQAACKVEFQPFNRSYSKLTFFIFFVENLYLVVLLVVYTYLVVSGVRMVPGIYTVLVVPATHVWYHPAAPPVRSAMMYLISLLYTVPGEVPGSKYYL